MIMNWLVTTDSGENFEVETRDRIDWVDDYSDATLVVGAIARFTYKTLFERSSRIHSFERSVSQGLKQTLEDCHHQGVLALLEDNDFERPYSVKNTSTRV